MTTQAMIEGMLARLPLLPPTVLHAVYEIVLAVPETLDMESMSSA